MTSANAAALAFSKNWPGAVSVRVCAAAGLTFSSPVWRSGIGATSAGVTVRMYSGRNHLTKWEDIDRLMLFEMPTRSGSTAGWSVSVVPRPARPLVRPGCTYSRSQVGRAQAHEMVSSLEAWRQRQG